MKYTKVTIQLSQIEPYRDLLIYSLGDEGPYDSFEEMPDGLKAYVPTHLFDKEFLEQCLESLSSLLSEQPNNLQCHYEIEEMPDKDYNEEWEKQHQPVLVENFCWVRAPFHPHCDDVKYEIEIEPKMSFGTAHHSTTYLMLSLLEKEDVEGKRVLDMGCGTGVLAILAAKKGAAQVTAIDVDEWAFRNAKENFERNNVNVEPILGNASNLTSCAPFDIILANINRNILLHDMEAYIGALIRGGIILMSGFYENDIEAIASKAATKGMRLENKMIRDGWAAIKLI